MSAASPIRTTLSRQASWLACLVVFSAALLPDAAAQSRRYRPPARYIQLGQPDQAAGRKILESFRGQGIAGDYFLEFDLRVLPRRGETRVVTGGKLWGGRNEIGPVSRVELPASGDVPARRLLVQNGPQSAVWQAGGRFDETVVSDAAALFTSLAGTGLTAFDLQMPFIYWSDFVYEGLAPVRGRPAHVFLLYPPETIAAQRPDLAGVRVYLDTQFGALVQSEQIGEGERVLKSMAVLDLKKVDDQWMVKTIDLRDEVTREKTQFIVKGAALGLDFSPVLFSPEMLGRAITPPDAMRIRRLSP